MSISKFYVSFALLFLLSLSLFAAAVECSRSDLKRYLKEDEKLPFLRPPNKAEIADFEAWISREGMRAQLKKGNAAAGAAASRQKRSTGDASNSSVDGNTRLDVQTWIVVDQNGYGQFTKVQDAIDSIPGDQQRTTRITIQVNPGYYNEKIVIAKDLPYLTLQGGGRLNTIISNAETEEEAGSDILDATLLISAPNFIARNISVQNSAPAAPSGAVGQAATGVCVSGDMAAFYGCGFLGAQDTLYDHNGRHYFEECYIQGSIDFIFGDGRSLYKNCDLNVIPTETGSLTAQKRMNRSEDTGFSFVDCAVTGQGEVYLGRAWGRYSRTVFAYTWLADIIIPAGWEDWSDPSRDSTVYYGEYDCFGPGANFTGTVSWSRQLSYEEAQPFLDLNFIDGEDWVY